MTDFHHALTVYREQLAQGEIQVAYRGLMDYLLGLRGHFDKAHPELAASSMYLGYMDMSYFALFPPALKARKLKVAIVFLHEAFRFEGWLSAANKTVQARCLRLIRESGWERYRLVPTAQGYDSIVECTLADEPDFRDPAALTRRIERAALDFIGELEGFLIAHPLED